MMRLACYKTIRPGWQSLYSHFVRFWTRSIYSHAEIIFSDGMAASSSFIDGGVRFKKIDFNPEHWDFVDLTGFSEVDARLWFELHDHAPYDVMGLVRFLFPPLPESRDKWLCTEAIGAALSINDSWRYDVATIKSALQTIRFKT